jgi:hypothetical protein
MKIYFLMPTALTLCISHMVPSTDISKSKIQLTLNPDESALLLLVCSNVSKSSSFPVYSAHPSPSRLSHNFSASVWFWLHDAQVQGLDLKYGTVVVDVVVDNQPSRNCNHCLMRFISMWVRSCSHMLTWVTVRR